MVSEMSHTELKSGSSTVHVLLFKAFVAIHLNRNTRQRFSTTTKIPLVYRKSRQLGTIFLY